MSLNIEPHIYTHSHNVTSVAVTGRNRNQQIC